MLLSMSSLYTISKAANSPVRFIDKGHIDRLIDRKNCDRQKELPLHGLLDTMYRGVMDRSLSVFERLDPLVLYYKGL